MFVLVILVYVLIGIIEIVPLIKNNQKKELILYSFLFVAAFILSLLLSLGVDIPSPADYIQKAVEAIIGK
ncbi:MAG: hypothetical protein MJA31_03495 [Clostridia bacterium]|nr:hypothetical protein [Clostridia bacterium]